MSRRSSGSKSVNGRFNWPSPSMAVALTALMIALGGTGYAAFNLPKNSVGSKQLKKNSVTGKKLKRNSVNSSKVRNRSLLAADFKKGQLPAGKQGPAGPPGPIEGTPAGGSLSGTYPDPTIATGAVGPDQLGATPAGRALSNVVQSIPNTTGTVVEITGGPLNQGGMISNSDDSFKISRPGVYAITGSIGWVGNSAGTRQTRILINGALQATDMVNAADSGVIRQNVSSLNRLNVGDEIQLGAFQNSGGPLNTSVSTPQGAVWLAAYWVSP